MSFGYRDVDWVDPEDCENEEEYEERLEAARDYADWVHDCMRDEEMGV